MISWTSNCARIVVQAAKKTPKTRIPMHEVRRATDIFGLRKKLGEARTGPHNGLVSLGSGGNANRFRNHAASGARGIAPSVIFWRQISIVLFPAGFRRPADSLKNCAGIGHVHDLWRAPSSDANRDFSSSSIRRARNPANHYIQHGGSFTSGISNNTGAASRSPSRIRCRAGGFRRPWRRALRWETGHRPHAWCRLWPHR